MAATHDGGLAGEPERGAGTRPRHSRARPISMKLNAADGAIRPGAPGFPSFRDRDQCLVDADIPAGRVLQEREGADGEDGRGTERPQRRPGDVAAGDPASGPVSCG